MRNRAIAALAVLALAATLPVGPLRADVKSVRVGVNGVT